MSSSITTKRSSPWDRWRRLRHRVDAWRFGSVDPGAKLGDRGEQAAACHLRRRGYVVVAQSERDRRGEIDLIAIEPKSKKVVFVEVKTTCSTKPGHPADRVTEDKQKRIARAALRYLKRHAMLEASVRFDVIAVWFYGTDPTIPDRLEHFESAFDSPLASGFYG